MKLYFATSYNPFGELKKLKSWKVSNVLSTYYVLRKNKLNKNIEKYKSSGFNLFLDSGAFSAFNKNEKINIDEYIDFIKKTKNIWNVYAGLDVIGDYKKSKENQEYMELKGLSPLPTFHYRSPYKELERLCEKYDYIALGGLVPIALNIKEMRRHLDYCFSIIKKYYPKKIHGFGVNSYWSWERYPFYSVDATSWNMGMKFGRTYTIEGLKMRQTREGDTKQFIKQKQGTWVDRTIMNIEALLETEKKITNLWKLRGINYEKESDRVRITKKYNKPLE